MVLASVVTAFIPSFRDEDRRRAAERTEACKALSRTGELPGGGPAALLDARRGLVDFTGRERELAELLAWCEGGEPRRMRLVIGAGGVGKTRLALELCARLEPRRWRCVWVGDREEASALRAARRGWPGRVLLVVDYAETRTGLADLLRKVVADAGVVRVLLLARGADGWWDRLGGGELAVRDLLSGAGGGEPLPVAVSAELSNVELVLAAVPVFAAALGGTAPSRVSVEVRSGAVRVLDLHAAALVAVLRSACAGGPVSVSVDDVLDELLRHEERFWQGTAQRLGMLAGTSGMSVATLRQIVAAGALLGAASQDQAMELLGRVPGAVASVKVACWLRDLYPPDAGPSQDGGGTEWLGALRPDRLAERLVVAQLTASRELAERCLNGLDERQALRAVTLLGRAAVDQQAVGSVLLERVLPLLEQVVAGLRADVKTLTAIHDAIPYPSAALAKADLANIRRFLQVLPDGDLGLRARWLSRLGITLAQIGRMAEALPVTQEAVEMRRELAAAFPGRYRAGLAAALVNLGVLFSELGRSADALPVTQEAVDAYRELAVAFPGRYRAGLAAALVNLGARFSELGRPADALPVTQEAVEIRRELAAASPGRYRAGLAAALVNLGILRWELGRPADALPVTQEAVDAYRELAVAFPGRYRAGLAASLTSLGILLWELGRPGEALPTAQEAVEIRRELAAASPGRYRAGLAAALVNLGVLFSEVGRSADALPVTQEAVDAYRELAAASPGRYRAGLAAALVNLGIWLSEVGRSADALPVTQEAVDAYRELAAASPGRYRASLARSLGALALALDGLGHTAEAEAARRDADLINNQ